MDRQLPLKSCMSFTRIFPLQTCRAQRNSASQHRRTKASFGDLSAFLPPPNETAKMAHQIGWDFLYDKSHENLGVCQPTQGKNVLLRD